MDPRTSNENGVFFVEDTDMAECLDDLTIGHNRDSETYSTVWYDQQDVYENEAEYLYYVDIPADTSDLYFSVETYYESYLPKACKGYVPDIYITVKQVDSDSVIGEIMYYDNYHNPLLIE